ncbi:MAG TPA: YkgJ family cysteine cluster protein, partial [Kofleriaceae bacterium]
EAAAAAGDPEVLWARVAPVHPPHATGLPPRTAGDGATCGTCAWRYEQRGAARCRQAGGARLEDAWPACERFERALDCQTCGACCRAAYHSVHVARRDPVVKKHPALVVDRTTYLEILRAGDHCAALEGGAFEGERATRFRCTIYDDRPRTCREFTLGSEHCLTARRRVGLSL